MDDCVILIKISKAGKGLIQLSLSDGSEIQVYPDIIPVFKLSKGKAITKDELLQINNEQRKFSAKRAAYAFASYKMRTESQVRQKLKDNKYDDCEIQIAIDKLYELNMLDDNKYAELFAKHLSQRKSLAPYGIIAELTKRGIQSETAHNAVMDIFENIDQYELALKAAEKKLKAIPHKTIEKQMSSVRNYLIRKGYKADIIRKVVNILFRQSDKSL